MTSSPVSSKVAFPSDETAELKWGVAKNIGSVTRHRDGRFFLYFRKDLQVWSDAKPDGTRYPWTEQDAWHVVFQVRGKVARERLSLEEAVAPYLPARSKPNLLETLLKRWLHYRQREMQAGEIGAKHYEQMCSYNRRAFVWWHPKSLYELKRASIEDWNLWMDEEAHLSPSSRAGALKHFHAFCSWLRGRDLLVVVPVFPRVKQMHYEPTILAAVQQQAVLDAIPLESRGIFLFMAHTGARMGEGRALNVGDYSAAKQEIRIRYAMKGQSANAERGSVKTKQERATDMTEELTEWIESSGYDRADLAAPLFVNHKTGRRWGYGPLASLWRAACIASGLPEPVKPSEGTRHTSATNWLDDGHGIQLVQEQLGHSKVTTTQRYAKTRRGKLEAMVRGKK